MTTTTVERAAEVEKHLYSQAVRLFVSIPLHSVEIVVMVVCKGWLREDERHESEGD